jgi:hypothetical protein
MKKFILCIGLWVSSIGVLMSVPSRIASQEVGEVQKINNEEALELHGTLAIGVMRSLIRPIEVSKSAFALTIHYLTHLSNIQVEILNESGQSLYSATVSPVAGDQSFVNLSSWQTGNYTIYFTNNTGGCIYGEFEIVDSPI